MIEMNENFRKTFEQVNARTKNLKILRAFHIFKDSSKVNN